MNEPKKVTVNGKEYVVPMPLSKVAHLETAFVFGFYEDRFLDLEVRVSGYRTGTYPFFFFTREDAKAWASIQNEIMEMWL